MKLVLENVLAQKFECGARVSTVQTKKKNSCGQVQVRGSVDNDKANMGVCGHR